MYFPILINWTSPFPILGLLGGISQFIHILKEVFVIKQREPDLTLCFAASDLDLDCLPMSHKKDAWLYGLKR